MNTSEVISKLWDAFFLGWGYGQGQMEEDMDNDFADAFLQGIEARKYGWVNHHISLPNTFDINEKGEMVNIRPDYDHKYVRYKLHSDAWRDAMLSKMDEFLKLIKDIELKDLDHRLNEQ